MSISSTRRRRSFPPNGRDFRVVAQIGCRRMTPLMWLAKPDRKRLVRPPIGRIRTG